MLAATLAILLATLVEVRGHTHAPPPWRVARAAPPAPPASRARRAIDEQLQLAPDHHVHLQAQQQLRHLQQISRAHLQNWAALHRQQMKPQVRQQQSDASVQPNDRTGTSATTTHKRVLVSARSMD